MKSKLSTSLLTAVPMPLVLVGSDERIRAMNPASADLFGLAAIDRHYLTVFRQPGLQVCIEDALRDGRQGQTRFLQNDINREATYKVTAAPVSGEGETGVLIAFEDVTDVERAGQMRRDFVANVSHELKSPLTALLGFIETLRGAARDDPAAQERFLGIMEREAVRMNRLVSDLLSLNRVESAERQRPTAPVNMVELVDSTLSALRPLAESTGVAIEVLKNPDDDLTVAGDADQLQQVLTNLVENAIKYGGKGERVTIGLTRKPRELAIRGAGVELLVEDFGDGFDPVHIPRLTERFYRVDDHRSRAKGGTGLGLAIAKHIVNRHRGRFRIDSAPGQGARFSVLLPAYR